MANITPQELVAQEEVKSSSSDNIYIVSLYKNCVSCTCPAGGRKTLCKHMLGIIHKHFENLKETAPEFYENIVEILELKSSNGPKETIKQLSDNIIFVDRKTAETAHDNAKAIKKSKDKAFEKTIDKIEQNFTPEQMDVILSILKDIKPHLFKTIMYLKRRLGYKKYTEAWNPITDEWLDIQEDYIAGGEQVEELLKKYGVINE